MRLTRRRFGLLMAAVLGGVGLFGVSSFWPYLKYYLIPVKEVSGSIKTPRPNLFKDGEDRSLVSLVLGGGRQDEVAEMVKASVDLIGGIGKIDVRGKTVLLKPNLNSGDPYPASTNPQVVKGVIEILQDSGASEIVVGDMSNPNYRTRDAMRRAGITDVAEETGASTVFFEEGEWVSLKIPEARHIGEVLLAKSVYEADVLIDLPTVKTHGLAVYTMSMKNFIGAIHTRSRMAMHGSGSLEEAIAELNLAVHPDLVVMDGTKSMVAGGPIEGTVKDTNMVIASGDRVANDIVGLSVVKMFGLWDRVNGRDVWDQVQIRRALELNIGRDRSGVRLVSRSLAGEEPLQQLLEEIHRISGI